MAPNTAPTDSGDVDLSLVIVNWNALGSLRACLDSLLAHPPASSWEAIVVDNGSTDGSAEWLAADAAWVRVIANRSNRGLSAANNQGLVAAQGGAVLICNPDVVFSEGAIDALADLLRRRPNAGVAVARLVQADGSAQVSVGDLPTFGDAFLGRLGSGRSGFWWKGWAHDEEVRVGHGQEACYLVRREAVAGAGAQDERFVLDWEGIDWSDRIGQSGWEIWFCPSATIRHQGGASIHQARIRWVASTHRGMYRYFAKRRPLALRPLLLAACAARGTAKALAVTLSPDEYERAQVQARI